MRVHGPSVFHGGELSAVAGDVSNAEGGGRGREAAPAPSLSLKGNNCIIPEGEKDPDHQKFTARLARSAWALAYNVTALCERHGIEKVGFLTLTFPDDVQDFREAQRRFKSLRTNVLATRYASWVVVMERTKKRRIHYHLLVVLASDIRAGVNWQEFDEGEYRSAGSFLRQEWAFLRETLPNYGFGRHELLPIKAGAIGIGNYIGKYIAKHVSHREVDDKGARLVRYAQGASRAGCHFSFDSKGSRLWRAAVAHYAKLAGVQDLGGMTQAYGKSWAYRLGETILRCYAMGEAAPNIYHDARTGKTLITPNARHHHD